MAGSIEIRGLTKRYGAFTAVDQVNISIPEGTFLSLLGPSGCGKTTTLRMLAGFIEPTAGTIEVDGTTVSRPGFVQPPEQRAMGMVFQSYAIWPHMSVFDNVAYGLRYGPGRLSKKAERRARVNKMIALVGLEGQQAKMPSELSGGQQQRVAVARALITEPKILLLDEPLSNLDAKLRESMRFELRSLQKRVGITTVFVTHSQEEALLLSDTIVVMRSGQIIEQAEPEQLYRAPRTRFVAEFVGLANFFEGTVKQTSGGSAIVETGAGTIACVTHWPVESGNHAQVVVRPESIQLNIASQTPPGVANRFTGVVREAMFNGSIVDYIVEVSCPQTVTMRVQKFAPRMFSEGQQVEVSFSAEDAKVVQ